MTPLSDPLDTESLIPTPLYQTIGSTTITAVLAVMSLIDLGNHNGRGRRMTENAWNGGIMGGRKAQRLDRVGDLSYEPVFLSL